MTFYSSVIVCFDGTASGSMKNFSCEGNFLFRLVRGDKESELLRVIRAVRHIRAVDEEVHFTLLLTLFWRLGPSHSFMYQHNTWANVFGGAWIPISFHFSTTQHGSIGICLGLCKIVSISQLAGRPPKLCYCFCYYCSTTYLLCPMSAQFVLFVCCNIWPSGKPVSL